MSGYQQYQILPGKDRVKDNPDDYYETPQQLARSAMRVIPLDSGSPRRVLDPGAGMGIWGAEVRKYFPHVTSIVGVEIDERLSCAEGYTHWIHTDYRDFDPQKYGLTNFDLIVGNPPYGVSQGKRDRLLAEKFVLKSLSMLSSRGYVLFLLKTAFLESAERFHGLFHKHRPDKVYILANRIPFKPLEYGSKTNQISYALFLWSAQPTSHTFLYWMDWKTGEIR